MASVVSRPKKRRGGRVTPKKRRYREGMSYAEMLADRSPEEIAEFRERVQRDIVMYPDSPTIRGWARAFGIVS